MVVCLRREVSFAQRYQIKNHRHFCNIPEAHFLENHCFNYFEGCEHTQQEICPCCYFFNCFFFFNYLSQKSRLFGQTSPIFENMYHEN